MKRLRTTILVLSGAVSLVGLTTGAASAQILVSPEATPIENTSGGGPIIPFGIHTSFAQLLLLLSLLIVVVIVILYMRYAPRFAKDEESAKVVRADRVVLGQELPRRSVDLSQAAPVLVAPPAIAAPQPALAAAAAAAPAPAAAAPAPAAAAPAPAAAAPAPAADAPAAAPAPAAAAAPAPPPAPAAPAERVEVTMDQEVFDATLAELLAAGTDRRIAEGKARRAGMIAAKKKAAGEG
jgi:hypothetical protein